MRSPQWTRRSSGYTMRIRQPAYRRPKQNSPANNVELESWPGLSGLVPAVTPLPVPTLPRVRGGGGCKKAVDARDKRGHDDREGLTSDRVRVLPKIGSIARRRPKISPPGPTSRCPCAERRRVRRVSSSWVLLPG